MVSTLAICMYVVLISLWTLWLQLFTTLALSFLGVDSTQKFIFLASELGCAVFGSGYFVI